MPFDAPPGLIAAVERETTARREVEANVGSRRVVVTQPTPLNTARLRKSAPLQDGPQVVPGSSSRARFMPCSAG
jgi:hypothetical protein